MVDLKDKILGVIYGTAIGDALGYAVEFDTSVNPNNPRVFSQSVPRLYSDDTQMFRAVCEGLLRMSADERVEDPLNAAAEEIAEEFVAWSKSPENNRAPGNACMTGCRNLEKGEPWRVAGAKSGGCGTAMRSMAYGIWFHEDPKQAATWAAKHSLMTHRDPMAQAAAAAVAAGVATFMGKDGPSRTHDDFYLGAMFGVAAEYDGNTASMLREAFAARDADPYDILDKWRGWAGHEAVAASLWCYLRYPDKYEEAVLLAANSPGDSDSIAAITGALVGASVGLSGIPKRWVEQVEKTEELMYLGKRICKALGVKW